MARPRSGDWNPTDIAAKMRYYRKAISVGMKLRGKAFSVPEYREHLRYETQKARRRAYVLGHKSWSWLPELLTMIGIDPEEAIWVGAYGPFEPTMRVDLVTVHAEWKRTAARLHPDRQGGDEAKIKRLNELWKKYQDASFAVRILKVAVPVTKPAKRRKFSNEKDRRKTNVAGHTPDEATCTPVIKTVSVTEDESGLTQGSLPSGSIPLVDQVFLSNASGFHTAQSSASIERRTGAVGLQGTDYYRLRPIFGLSGC